MDNEVEDGQKSAKGDHFFFEDSGSSEDEGETKFRHQEHRRSGGRAARLSGEGSPPLLLAFSSSRIALQDARLGSPAELQEEDSDESTEKWMILDEEEQVGDSSIQLNLSYWNSSEDDSGDEEITEENVKSVKETWAVSERDKYGADPFLASRYFIPSRSLICRICNRTGHLAKSCYLHKKCPTCVLCGIRGHIQRDCPGRPCPSCLLPSHGLRPCEIPSLWNQHCQRCGMTGHLSDACPDTWRQFHLTIRLEVPLRPRTVHNLRHKRYHTHCYNCSKRGHYGFECTRRRMISGTFPTLPYVSHYDTKEDILQHRMRMQKRTKEHASAGSLTPSDLERLCEKNGESGEETQSVQRRSRTKQEACSRAGRRKTWPERRRERREVKRLRREAQFMREGGLMGRSLGNSDNEVCPADSFRQSPHRHRQSTPPPQKKRRDETSFRRAVRAQRWKKREAFKHGDLYPHGDVDIGSENLLSPKQRVRHRRR
ncbi:zinc finger CCHC domain-containing protein 7-like isoform X1 [Embiotoca jacksoni]|uniref:zinc finger CCHC domain-containing protein 7-like isoform X1 n=1 Tax=Embiotoca jacksoni TaxID=100190 RepID=UPI003704847C